MVLCYIFICERALGGNMFCEVNKTLFSCHLNVWSIKTVKQHTCFYPIRTTVGVEIQPLVAENSTTLEYTCLHR